MCMRYVARNSTSSRLKNSIYETHEKTSGFCIMDRVAYLLSNKNLIIVDQPFVRQVKIYKFHTFIIY